MPLPTTSTLLLAGALALAAAVPVAAQDSPAFEVASVRKSVTSVPTSGSLSELMESLPQIRTLPGGRFHADTELRYLISWAWGLKRYERVEGSARLLNERFDIVANAPTDAPMPAPGENGPFRQMLQTLLIERFNLKVRIEHEMQPAMVLRQASSGKLEPGLRPTSFECPTGPRPAPDSPEADAWRRCRTGMINGTYDGVVPSMAAFAEFLSMAHHVVDETGLDGAYEITTTFDLEPLSALRFPGPPRDLPSFAQAMRDDLGLRVDTERRPVTVVIVEHVEEPTEN